MALPNESHRSFRLYVTHVDGEGHFLKISGQLDQPSTLMLEALFNTARESLEKGIGSVPPGAIHEGIICAAKYKDGMYYRAKIINTSKLTSGLVGVHFIDFGNKDIISLSTIRFLDSYDPIFLQLPGQASDYYLAQIIHPSGRWEEPLLLKLQSLLCYADYPVTVELQTRTLPMISIQFKGNDLSTHLVSNRFGVTIPLQKQEVLLLHLHGENPQMTNWQPSLISESAPYTEHVPFLVNQNFPSNPASAMRLQQNVSLPLNASVLSPSPVSQRLFANKASRNPVNLSAAIRQPQQVMIPLSTPPLQSQTSSKPSSPKKCSKYKTRMLEVNSQHKVFVSFAEDGPTMFAVQLVSDANKLQEMMDEINKRPHHCLTEPPLIGTMCLGRMSGDRIICRAIVVSSSENQCLLFFVDFGDTELVSYYDIFYIPEEFVKPNVFAMKFCLSKVKTLNKGPQLIETFKQIVNEKVLTLRVVPPEGPPLLQYGELYLDNKNVLELLTANMKDKLQFRWMEMLTLGSRRSVLVSYVDSCIKFFVQLSDKIDELNAVMDKVKSHCESSSSPGVLPVGAACCARFPDDNNWYRALVKDIRGNKALVTYVDYGNEQEVDISHLRTITPDLVNLPAQALKCALKSFENKPVETKTSNQLEMLALEKTLMANVVGVLSNDTMLISLVDDTVNPPLDVARRMNQLSQPRSNNEIKSTTPIRKDGPDSFSSPEGSVTPDDSRKKGFRREKSFKDDHRRSYKDGNDEFAQRSGSFRSRDNKDSFDRSGPSRHSERFGGRPDRNERREGPKPRENRENQPPPAATSDDGWDEPPAQTSFPPPTNRQNRDNRDRRKPRVDHQHEKPAQRPGWKNKEGGGVGKRLRQAAESASVVQAQPAGSSVQDRLKRDNKFNNKQSDWEGDKGNNDWGNRRDNRGEKRDNWGDKKESWNQKREYRGERSDRPRSNFTPRDRAESSFGSDSDKRSDRSFRSQDNGRTGRAPPYKNHSKFTQVQYKELPDPLPLDTPFTELVIEPDSQHEVSVTWIISPESFYTQILSQQPKFLEMMHKIPELYKGVRSYTGPVPVGASVLARYPVDGVLYRATVIAVQPLSRFIVRYVDFGNKQLVDAKDIWQMDRQMMELPKMAVHCSLIGVRPADGEWKADTEIDLCFNAPRYQCVFQEVVEDQHKVSMWNNGVSVADMLVEKQLAVMSEQQSSVTLKDEAIDLTIIEGQQILCRVTHVESFEKFFVQLDLDKAALVETAIANFDANLLTPLDAELLTDGTHCTVNHEGKIYRAVLQDAADAANITVLLADYGNVITTTLDKLMILPTELSVYYYQSLECCFNNYTQECKALLTLDDLKERLTGNKFIIYINGVDEIRLVTTLYEKVSGEKIAVFEPDEGAYEHVVPLCMRSVFNYNFGLAYISHSENLNEIYLQKSEDGDKIAQLLDELFKFYEEGTPEPQTTLEVDELCAAKSSDGNWYRATILKATETEVKVQFPDYGNTETVSKDSLKKLDNKFYEPCALALVVGLGLVALQEDALPKLLEWTNEKEVQVTLAFGADGWLASLHLDGVDLSMKLVNEKLATPQIISNEEPKIEPVELEEPISLPEGCTQVYISHIDTPGHFWLQMADKVDKIDEIQAELQTNADTYGDIETREMGTMCIAKYSADDQWYRAEILDSDSDITTVRFIDYGNTDVLDNQPGLLKAMPDHLKETERYAVKSSVNAVPTGTGQWSEPASDHFTQLVGDLSAPVDALIVLKDIMTYVDIFVHGENLTDKLVSEGYATRSEEPICGDLPSCFASHVNSPAEFWIQLETAAPELQAMEAAMDDAENFPLLTEKEEGVICAAKYPEDGAWYRAQVIVDGSEGTEVLFMDYGNASIATELRSLPDELKVKPALSRKCALQKPRDIKSWSRKSEIKFNELAAEGATIFNVQFIASGDISIVELYLEGTSVTEELVGLCEEHPAMERPTPVGQDLHCNGKICYVNSLDEFYVHLDDSVSDLGKITDRLVEGPEFEPVSELKVGSVCAAFWSDDEQWYRAKILEFCDVGYHVQFVDYGNKAKCEEFRQLPEDLSGIEPIAKCCRLAGFDDKTNESAKNKLDDLAADDSVTFQIEFLDSTNIPTLVRLSMNGEDVATILKADTKAEEVFTENVVDDFKLNPVKSDENVEELHEISEKEVQEKNLDVAESGSQDTENVKELHAISKKEVQEKNLDVAETGSLDTENVKELHAISKKVQEKNLDVAETGSQDTENVKELHAISKKEVQEKNLDVAESGSQDTENIKELHAISKTEVQEKNLDIAENGLQDTEELRLDTSTDLINEVNNEELDETNELDTSQPDLDESIDSTHTVIENKSFDGKLDNFNDDIIVDDNTQDTSTTSTEKETSSSTLEISTETIKTSERDDSKDSLNLDTGYNSNSDQQSKSPINSPASDESEAPIEVTNNESLTNVIKAETEMKPTDVDKEKDTVKVDDNQRKSEIEMPN